MKKIFISILSVVACAFVFAGCKAGESVESASSSETANGESNSSLEETSVDGENESGSGNASNDSASSDSGDTESDEKEEESEPMFTVKNAIDGVVYPYVDAAKTYLEAPAGSDVKDYCTRFVSNPNKAITLEWDFDTDGVEGYVFTYATKDDYADGVTVSLDAATTSYDLYNLYKDTEYFCKIEAQIGGELKVRETNFKTTDLGPRVMKVDGIYNVRDLGGYTTSSGKTTVQGLLYRGGALNLHYDANGNVVYNSLLTEKGKAFMSEELGIRSELDIRGYGEESGYATESPIPGATLKYITLDGYSSAFSMKENYRQTFSFLANKNNYPVYFHCTGGADRTGTVAFLFNALLGVSELDLIHDYEMTTFSLYQLRSAQSTEHFPPFYNTLKNDYAGDSLAEKVENYLLSIGVTATEIANIRAIMFGEELVSTFSPMGSFNPYDGKAYEIGVANADADLKIVSVTIGEEDVEFTFDGSRITIEADDFPVLESGKINAAVKVENGKEYPFTFDYDDMRILSVNEYLPLTNGSLTLDSTTEKILGEKALGYGNTVRMNVTTTPANGSGGWWIFVGSYGFHFRGGTVRMWTTVDGVNFTEVSPRVTDGTISHGLFDRGVTLACRVELVDEDTARGTLTVIDGDGIKLTVSYDFARIDHEIASENACLAVGIRTDAIECLTVTA